MIKDREQTVEILKFLVLNYRKARNIGGNYDAIVHCMNKYRAALMEEGMTEKENEIIYLESKIRAGEEQVQEYRDEMMRLKKS